MTFLLSEDEALKAYLKGTVRVSDATDGSRPVPVYFGMPEKELHQLSFPAIYLELIDVAEETDRVHRGPANPWLGYKPDGFVNDIPEGFKAASVLLPQPFRLTYQITTLARHPRHDRQMLATMNVGRLSVRGGSIPVEDDQTFRRLDRLGFAKRDTVDENRKRVYRNVFTYGMSAELFPEQWMRIAQTVDHVRLNDLEIDTDGDGTPDVLDDAPPELMSTLDVVLYP